MKLETKGSQLTQYDRLKSEICVEENTDAVLSNELLDKEIFFIPIENGTLVYAPLTRSFCVYDGPVSREDLEGEYFWVSEAVDIKNVPEFVAQKGFEYDRDKVRLRLNLTSSCNLNCRYCSVGATNHSVQNMPLDLVVSSVDNFVDFAKQSKAKCLELTFSGGEPTLQMDSIKAAINRAEERLKDSQIQLVTKLITNGVWDQDRFEEIVGLFNGIQISWDGFLEDNPRYSDRIGLEKKVWDNIGYLVERGVVVNILSVISKYNQYCIRQIVDDLYERYGVVNIFLSLQDNLGRTKQQERQLDYTEIGREYIELWKHYRAQGIDIGLTGTNIHAISAFPCSVATPNYSIGPDGQISACTIAFNDNSELSRFFTIGKIENDGFVLDQAKIDTLRKIHVLNIPGCEDCFAKWHCRGQCPYSDRPPEERCQMTREILKQKLLWLIENQS